MKRSQEPVVLGLMGLPGAGKSHFANRLAHHTGWALLDRDRTRLDRFPDGRSDRGATKIAEAILAQRLDREVVAGHSLILDGMTLARRADRERWAGRTRQAGGTWRLIFLDCPMDTAISRVEADRTTAGYHPATDRNADLVHAVAKRLERPNEDEPVRVLQGDSRPEDILDWLGIAR